MEINEFARKVCDAVEKKLGNEYRTELREVRKNNGVLLHGMLILTGEQKVVPTIYLDSFWEDYESGTPFAAIIRRLLSIYREDTPKRGINVDFFRFFEEVRDRICYRLVGRKGNEVLLREVPYVEFLDLAICFYYAYSDDVFGEGTILIHNSHMQMWGTGTAELYRLAKRNTPRIFPWECSTMRDVLQETIKQDMSGNLPVLAEDAWQVPMRVLSNVKRLHGAACILYPGVLETIAAAEGGSFYIIPSSIHEMIVLTDTENESPEELKRIIREVNSTQVAPEEVLSDNLYYYSFQDKKIKIASK